MDDGTLRRELNGGTLLVQRTAARVVDFERWRFHVFDINLRLFYVDFCRGPSLYLITLSAFSNSAETSSLVAYLGAGLLDHWFERDTVSFETQQVSETNPSLFPGAVPCQAQN
jgi:hypothetical protein